jgi:zinc protease
LIQICHSRPFVDANNFGILYEQLFATAYTAHPYQWPVVGWMVDIENWSMDDLKHHFEMGYSPSGAIGSAARTLALRGT